MSFLSLRGLTKAYGDIDALSGLSIDVNEGEFFAILGPSSAGKTTALRTICGLETPDSGTVVFEGRDVTDVPPRSRGMAMIFQSFALYPHLTTAENLAYPLRESGMKAGDVKRRLHETADLLNIAHAMDRRPATLSGGEQQRVAIGRALIRRPRLLLLDEPMTNLDAKLRHDMRAEFKRLHRELGMTLIYATPDQSEALSMAERVAVIVEGRIAACDNPRALYHDPDNTTVATLVGAPPMNLVHGRIEATDEARITLQLALGRIPLDLPKREGITGLDIGREVFFGVRPHALRPARESDSADCRFDAQVHLTEPLGDITVVDLKVNDIDLKMVLPESEALTLRTGDTMGIGFDAASARVFDINDGARLM